MPLPPERPRAGTNGWALPAPKMNRETRSESPASSSGYSAEELLRHKDLEQMTWAETEQVGRLLEQSPWRMADRRTRRLRPSRSGRIDLRRSARQAIRSSGELMTLFRRKPRVRRRPIVLICDVSGSMERYSRLLMIFAHAISRREDLEAFVFSTRLTRITRLLRHRDSDRAPETVTKALHDFTCATQFAGA